MDIITLVVGVAIGLVLAVVSKVVYNWATKQVGSAEAAVKSAANTVVSKT
jgi:hypothetical protein